MRKFLPILLVFVTISSTVILAQQAKPIWPEGRETEMNLTVGFRCVIPDPGSENVTLKISGSSLYRVFLNGRFMGHGPARGPHGYYRIDKWKLSPSLFKPENIIAIEVAGYNVNSFYLLDEPAFLQAEVISDKKVIASTQGPGIQFEASILKSRVQKVQRYSFQRTFTEYYRFDTEFDAWKSNPDAVIDTVKCIPQETRKFITRRIAYPEFKKIVPSTLVSTGSLETGMKPQNLWRDRALVNIGPQFKGYNLQELEIIASDELQTIKNEISKKIGLDYNQDKDITLAEKEFAILDLDINLTGFVGATVQCTKPSRLYITFDEILQDDDVNFKRLSCVNAIGYELKPGTYRLESFEPYTLRFLKFNCLEGDCRIKNVYLREYTCPEASLGQFSCSDERLNEIFEAARQTFRQNAVDIFMDCPSRERAGWLCDSFFTARVAKDLCGNTTIEKNMYENYLLPESFAYLPEGMLPMCYPADQYNGNFIPNWALWFVIQLEEYYQRSGDKELVESLEPRVMRLLQYFEKFRNEDGLLEKLEKWVFVEWSKANSFVQDLNYPSNMLYAEVLAVSGRLYDKPSLISESKKLKKIILKQSYDGQFFIDNALRRDGKLEITSNHSEICQYYAFFFEIVSPDTHPELWKKLQNEFGPKRKETNAYPNVHVANAFIGNYMRLELLSRYGRNEQIRNELLDYFLYMARQTGTLWENVGAYASCNHGFASHAAHSLYRDILGLYDIDTVNKKIVLRIADTGLDKCSGLIPTGDGNISLSWIKKNGVILYELNKPRQYDVIISETSIKIKKL